MKLAFIVQRYGRDILGGSETLARQLAERLGRRHEITVLTTTAQDYITWKSEYEPGEEKHRGVSILRFPVVKERVLEEFNKFSEEIYGGQASREQELEWLDRQGPVVPELIEYLKKEHQRFDLLIFFTYLYYPTYYGLQVAPEKSILVPTAHDEPPLRLGIFREMFQLPSSYLFNTEAEEVLVLERFPVHKKMRETVGMGMDLLEQPDTSAFRRKHNIPGAYLLYAGRIDAGKGLEELFRYFTFYKEENPASGNLQLILIGRLGMKLPDDPAIRYIGYVDEGDKLSAMAGAAAIVQPSGMESLSIVTLEAFSVGSPVIANAASRVLVDHCRKANAGFFYRDFEEFEAILDLLFSDRALGKSLGKNGQRYVKDNYGWSKVLSKYELVFRASARPARERRPGKVIAAPPPAGTASPTSSRTPGDRDAQRKETVSSSDAEPPQSGIETAEMEKVEARDEMSLDVEAQVEASPPEAPAVEAPQASRSSESESESESENEVRSPGTRETPREAAQARANFEPPVRPSEPIAAETAPELPGEPEGPETSGGADDGYADSGRNAEAVADSDSESDSEAKVAADADDDSPLPSFYRGSIPAPPSKPQPRVEPETSELEPARPVLARDESVTEKEEKTADAEGDETASGEKEDDEAPSEPGELPEFFRPREPHDGEEEGSAKG